MTKLLKGNTGEVSASTQLIQKFSTIGKGKTTNDTIMSFVAELLSDNPFASYLGESIGESNRNLLVKFKELANLWRDNFSRDQELRNAYNAYMDTLGIGIPQGGIALSFIIKNIGLLIGKMVDPKKKVKTVAKKELKKSLSPSKDKYEADLGSKVVMEELASSFDQEGPVVAEPVDRRNVNPEPIINTEKIGQEIVMEDIAPQKTEGTELFEKILKAKGNIDTGDLQKLLTMLSEREEADIYIREFAQLPAGSLVKLLCKGEYRNYITLHNLYTHDKSRQNGQISPNEYRLEKNFIEGILRGSRDNIHGFPLNTILK